MTQPTLAGTGCAMHEPFALQVLGGEMEPEFPDRCVVIIEPTDRCQDGMYVFAEVEGVRWLRRYQRDADGRERLVALDRRFPDIPLAGLEWSVLGVVIQRNIRRKIKHYDYAPRTETAPPQVIDLSGR